jgi:hypothetical protein
MGGRGGGCASSLEKGGRKMSHCGTLSGYNEEEAWLLVKVRLDGLLCTACRLHELAD